MTSPEIPADVRAVVDESRAFQVLFVHAGSLYGPTATADKLVRELARGAWAPGIVHADDLEDAELSGRTVVVQGIERLADAVDRCSRLAHLRVWAMKQLAAGARLIVLSSVPK